MSKHISFIHHFNVCISHVILPAIEKDYKVTPFYDPMIAKLIVKGKDRNEAISRLQEALRQYKIEGVKTNIPLLIDIVKKDAFIKGNTKTTFINEHILNN